MPIKIQLAKFMMNLLPNAPVYLKDKLSETIYHIDFITASEDKKNEILFEMAEKQYQGSRLNPVDRFFPNYSLKTLLSGKTVLDLGCWCGGETVAFAENWNVSNMYGIDINYLFIRAAKLFTSSRHNDSIKYDFTVGFGENLPYDDDFFDAIVSTEVLEHVQSVRDTLKECKRVLKPNGMIFSVFPSYYEPFGGSHLNLVTKTPCLNWIFDAMTLNSAYDEIINSRGDSAHWYKQANPRKDWPKLHGGIGVNGTTIADFKSIINSIGFSNIQIIPNHILAFRYPKTRILSKLIRGNFLQDRLSNRIVSILTK
jgi:ubiquinone/menaquinone biosynthesis C-methylase UbiE